MFTYTYLSKIYPFLRDFLADQRFKKADLKATETILFTSIGNFLHTES